MISNEIQKVRSWQEEKRDELQRRQKRYFQILESQKVCTTRLGVTLPQGSHRNTITSYEAACVNRDGQDNGWVFKGGDPSGSGEEFVLSSASLQKEEAILILLEQEILSKEEEKKQLSKVSQTEPKP